MSFEGATQAVKESLKVVQLFYDNIVCYVALWDEAPGREHWANTLENSVHCRPDQRLIAYECIDIGSPDNQEISDRRSISTYTVDEKTANLRPRSTHPFPSVAHSDTLQDFWRNFFPSRIVLIEQKNSTGNIALLSIPNYVIRTSQKDPNIDLGTMMANIATTSWTEGTLLCQRDNYRFRHCSIFPRPQGWTATNLGEGNVDSSRTIENPYNLVPRRLWDLAHNRVVDVDIFARRAPDGRIVAMRMPHQGYWAISHSWTFDMVRWMTPINHYQWPVPLPAGTTLDQIRRDALKAGAVYCWLDVLCLRQRMVDKAGEEINEQQRLQEWSIDVPTIGNNYRQATNIIRYFNGLGRPLTLTGWDGPRHWINRAWTLQETRPEYFMTNACVPEDLHCPLQATVQVGDVKQRIGDVLARVAQIIHKGEVHMYSEDTAILDARWSMIVQDRDTKPWPLTARDPAQWVRDIDNRGDRTYDARIRLILWFKFVITLICIKTACCLLPEIWHAQPLPSTLLSLPIHVLNIAFDFVGPSCFLLEHTGYHLVFDNPELELDSPRFSFTYRSFQRDGLTGRMVGMLLIGFCELYTLWYGSERSNLSSLVSFLSLAEMSPDKGVLLCSCSRGSQVAYWILSRLPVALLIAVGRPSVLHAYALYRRLVQRRVAQYLQVIWSLHNRLLQLLTPWPHRDVPAPLIPASNSSRTQYCSILELITEMTRRHATNDLDKIAGVGYLLKCQALPLYSETEALEDAWLRLVAQLPYPVQLELLFNFPAARENSNAIKENEVGGGQWIPTWIQLTQLQPEQGHSLHPLQCPAWPPPWLKAHTVLKCFQDNSHPDIYHSPSRTLFVPCCALVILVHTWVVHNPRLISIQIDNKKFFFYPPNNGKLDPLPGCLAGGFGLAFITHALEGEPRNVSWVLAESQCEAPVDALVRSDRVWGRTDLSKNENTRHPVKTRLKNAFNLDHSQEELIWVVKKRGTVVTEDPSAFTLLTKYPKPTVGMSFCENCVSINVPVAFV